MAPGRRANISRAAVQASIRAHYYSHHPAYRRSRVYLPPPQVQNLPSSLAPNVQAALADVGVQLADEIDPSKPMEDQVAHIEDIWRERFEAIVEPIVESMRDEVMDALEALVDEAVNSAADAETDDSQTATGWLAAAVLILGGGLVGGVALGVEVAHGHYANAVLWALALLLAVRDLLREE